MFLSANLPLTVYNAFISPRYHVPPFASSFLAASHEFYPQTHHYAFIGSQLYDYYGFI